jgi:hypothetical protein
MVLEELDDANCNKGYIKQALVDYRYLAPFGKGENATGKL